MSASSIPPWSGFWRLPSRDELQDGLYTITQFTAKQLLQNRAPRNQWEGDFLQAVLLHKGPLTPGQQHWFTRLCDDYLIDGGAA